METAEVDICPTVEDPMQKKMDFEIGAGILFVCRYVQMLSCFAKPVL